MDAPTFSKTPTGIPSSVAVLRFISSPGYLLFSVIVSIFVLEAAVMLLLMFLPRLSLYQRAFLDALILSVIVFPALYFLVFKPLRMHVDFRRKAETDKDRLILDLRKALEEVKTLKGFIPICSSCHKIRDDEGFWQRLELYISAHSDAQFSHGICPDCRKKLYPEFS